MKPFPNLTMTKVSGAEISWGDYGASAPQGPGDFSYRQPAVWRVIGPSGAAYMVSGQPRAWMQTPSWHYQREDDPSIYKGQFTSRIDALAHIDKRERALLAQPAGCRIIATKPLASDDDGYYLCAICGVAGPDHGHYDAADPTTHKFVSGKLVRP